jgi:hypothetical protein
MFEETSEENKLYNPKKDNILQRVLQNFKADQKRFSALTTNTTDIKATYGIELKRYQEDHREYEGVRYLTMVGPNKIRY